MPVDLNKHKKNAPAQTAAPAPTAPPPQGYDPATILSGIKDASESGRLPRLPVGTYKLQIDKCSLPEIRNPMKSAGHNFIVEFTVVETYTGTAKPGDRHSWVQMVSAGRGGKEKVQRDMALGAIKSFLYAVQGAKTPEQKVEIDGIFDEVINGVINENAYEGDFFRATSVTNPKDPQYVNLTFATAE